MKKEDLIKKIAKLESINDQLAAELDYLNRLAKSLGFAEGLKTLKSAALEMLEADSKKSSNPKAKENKTTEESDY